MCRAIPGSQGQASQAVREYQDHEAHMLFAAEPERQEGWQLRTKGGWRRRKEWGRKGGLLANQPGWFSSF